jgi:hypothetical protein
VIGNEKTSRPLVFALNLIKRREKNQYNECYQSVKENTQGKAVKKFPVNENSVQNDQLLLSANSDF